MELTSAFFLILAIIPAASFGWGMRGTTIGGEKGAMLPGALIGFILSYFSDILIIKENFLVFTALGAIGMYFGGAMTYGETLGLSMNANPPENKKKGLIALFIKGFLWFGVFGGFFSTGFNAVCGIYTLNELIILLVLLPISSLVFYFIFNFPYKPKENIFPKIYFSKTRRESWGSMLGLLLAFIGIAIAKAELFSLLFPLICAIFGGIGWVIGQLIQIYSLHIAPNSPSKIAKLFDSTKHAESWKIMECVLGSFGGLGSAIGFILTHETIRSSALNLENNGGLIYTNAIFSKIIFIVWIILLALDNTHYFVNNKIIKNVFEIAEPILYAGIPFIMICFGSDMTARILSIFIIFWVLIQEIAYEKIILKKYDILYKILLSMLGVGVLLIQLLSLNTISSIATLILYTVVYEALTLGWFYLRALSKSPSCPIQAAKTVFCNKSFLSVHIYFCICIILTFLYL